MCLFACCVAVRLVILNGMARNRSRKPGRLSGALGALKRSLKTILSIAGIAAAVGAIVYLAWLPDVSEYAVANPRTTAYIELRRAQARAKGRAFRLRMRWRPLSGISPNLVQAAIISEDGGFYRHRGIDWKELRNAFRRDWEKRKLVYGGSTITQQLARNLYLSPSKNPLRKIKEAVIALLLERKLGKKRILELYLNVAEWGNGVFGAEAAANAYFGHGAATLSPEEAVALVSILPSPRKWSPFSSGRKMTVRRGSLLSRMRRSGFLTDEATAEIAGSGGEKDLAIAPAVLSGADAGEPPAESSRPAVSVPER